MTNIETHKLYKGEVEIAFYPDSHRYKLAGEKTYLIGVTTATGMLDKSRPLLHWSAGLAQEYLLSQLQEGHPIDEATICSAVNQYNEKRDSAADTGSKIHEWIEQYLDSGNKEIPEDQQVAQGVIAFLDWIDKNDIKFEHSEKIVYSKKHQYVGRFDAIANINGTRYLIDFKSSKGVYNDFRYQLSAYLEAWNEEYNDNITKRMIVKLGKDTAEFETIELPEEDHQKDFECFISLLTLKKRDKELYKFNS